jgi:hypothetical protein
VDHGQLQRFLQDALSAAVGWTVIPPETRCIGPAGSGGVNWTLDTRHMDDSMRALVAWFQSRYDVDPMSCPAAAHQGGVLSRMLSWGLRRAQGLPRCRRFRRRSAQPWRTLG